MNNVENTGSQMSAEATTYINAGGRGTRLNTIFEPDPEFGIAKALLEVGNPPVRLVDHHIANALRPPIRNVVVGAGDLTPVATHVRHTYAENTRISSVNSQGHRQLGTAGDLVLAIREAPELFGANVLIKNVDTILDIGISEFIAFHGLARSVLTIAITRRRGVPNENAFYLDSENNVVYCAEVQGSLLSEDEAGDITAWRGSSTGAVIVDTDFIASLDWEPQKGQLSLYRDVIKDALHKDAVAGYDNGHNFFIDVGTEQTWLAAQGSAVLQPYLCYHDNNNPGGVK